MPQKAEKQHTNTTSVTANWQHAQQPYLSTATAVSASWCHFISERFDAYAHVIDEMSHCRDLNDAWQNQSAFGQQTFKAYSDEAAKLGGSMFQATNGGANGARH